MSESALNKITAVCPWCKVKPIGMVHYPGIYVASRCGAHGPHKKTDIEAVEAWNSWAAPTSPMPEEVREAGRDMVTIAGLEKWVSLFEELSTRDRADLRVINQHDAVVLARDLKAAVAAAGRSLPAHEGGVA